MFLPRAPFAFSEGVENPLLMIWGEGRVNLLEYIERLKTYLKGTRK
jgi:hypothetical protein